MPRMTFDEIKACLEREGWAVEVVSDDTMRSDFQGAERLFPLFVRLSPPFVVFAVIPFVRLPLELEEGAVLVRRLLQLNREINMAKLSADEEGDVILSASSTASRTSIRARCATLSMCSPSTRTSTMPSSWRSPRNERSPAPLQGGICSSLGLSPSCALSSVRTTRTRRTSRPRTTVSSTALPTAPRADRAPLPTRDPGHTRHQSR